MMNRRIDIHGTDEEYMDGDEEEGIFFEDSEISNEQMAPSLEATMVNPRGKKAAKFTVPWKALRLPAARGEGRMAELSGFLAGSKDIRSSPYAYVIPASSWTQYINNMDAKDVAAEMNAPVSEFEKASLYLFAEEWRQDVTHEAFKRRLIDHPLVNVGQEVAKGQLVFDLVVGEVTAKGGRPDTKYGEMLRLAMDVLGSIRLRYYSYYSVNLLHGHEGAAIYEEFLSRYTPLEANEVAIIQEISQGIQNQGRTYAVNTSNPMADAVVTFNLMMRVVESYNIGDTMTARAGISALLSAPINYKSTAKYSLKTDNMGRTTLFRDSDIIAVSFKAGDKNEAKKGTNVHYILKDDMVNNQAWPTSGSRDDQFNTVFRLGSSGSKWVEVKGPNDATPTHVISVQGGKLVRTSKSDFDKFSDAFDSAEKTVSQSRSNNQRRKRGSVRKNPGVMSNVPFDGAAEISQIRANLKKKTKESLSSWAERYLDQPLRVRMQQAPSLTVSVILFETNHGYRPFYAILQEYNRLGTMKKGLIEDLNELYNGTFEIDLQSSSGSIEFTYTPNTAPRETGPVVDWPSGPKSNPVAIGKGQHFFIQLRPKSQFSFNAKQKKMGSTAKGSMTVVGTPGRDTTGFVDLFGGFEKSGYVAWKGTHKDSGSSKSWMIQLPRKYGKGKSRGKGGDTVFKAARVTDKETGKSYRTIKPFTADKKIKAAWDKFVAMYGEPVFADDPKRPNLFRIRRKNRGAYYKRK